MEKIPDEIFSKGLEQLEKKEDLTPKSYRLKPIIITTAMSLAAIGATYAAISYKCKAEEQRHEKHLREYAIKAAYRIADTDHSGTLEENETAELRKKLGLEENINDVPTDSLMKYIKEAGQK